MDISINYTSRAAGKYPELFFQTSGKPRNYKIQSGHFFLKHPVEK
jgi:hypothetical protein